MKDIRKSLEQLKEIKDTDVKATQLWNIIYSVECGMEFAEELANDIAVRNYVVNKMRSKYENDEFESLGNLIKGITNWSAEWFHVDGYGNIEDLTNENIDNVIDDILSNLPNEDYWLVMNNDGYTICKDVSREVAQHYLTQMIEKEPDAGWVMECVISSINSKVE